MASFNPDPQVSELQARDQTGASRGTGTDRSFESLFSGLGDLIGGAAKTVDTSITNKIESDARYGFEGLNDEVGMSVNTVPNGLTQSSEGLQKLAMAHQQGKVTQEYYYQRLASTLKGLRTKYPGYEKEVDNIVQTVTGTRPANAFRDALFQNIETQQRAAATAAGKFDSWAAQKENSEVLGVLYPDFWTNQDKYASDDMKNKVRANVSQYQGRVRIAEDTVKLQSSDKAVARPQISRLFSTISNGYIVGGSEAVGVDSPNVQNMLQTALTDGTIDQAEKENILGLLAQVKSKAQVDMRNRVASSDWGSNFTSQEINEEVKNALGPIEEMEALVTSDNVSAAVRIAERNKAVTDQATADLYSKFPELGPASAVRNISQVAADTIVNDLIEKSGTGVDFVNKVLGKDLISGIAGGQVSLSQVTNRVAESQGKTSKEKQAILSQVLDGTTSILAAPDATKEVKLSTVKSVYSDKLDETWAAVDDSTSGATGTSQRFRLYSKMFNPEITKQVASLNDPEALRMYTAAAVDKFQQIPEFRRAAATLNADLPYNKYTKVQYDPDRNRLVFMVNREALRNTGFFTRTGQAEDAAAIGSTVDKINQALSVVVPIIEANGGEETEGVATLFRDLNLDLNQGKQTGFWGHVYQAIDNLTSGNVDAEGGIARPGSPMYERGRENNQRNQQLTDPNQTGEFEEIGAIGGASSSAPLAQQGDLVGDVMMANYVPESGNAGAQAIDQVTTQSVQQISADPQSWESVGSETLSALPQGDISFLVKDGQSVKQAASGPYTGDVSNFAGKTNPLEIASSFKGLTERTDARVIANFIRKSSGISINPADTAWCAAFVNGVLGASGSKGTGRLNARSFLNWGMPVEKPTEGDVVVFQRGSSEWQGHVGFYMGTETKDGKQYIRVLGGNQSNSVKESLYPADKLLGYRRANI